jgi:hypothetical protein
MNKKKKQRGKIKLLLSTIQQRSSTFQEGPNTQKGERGKGLEVKNKPFIPIMMAHWS